MVDGTTSAAAENEVALPSFQGYMDLRSRPMSCHTELFRLIRKVTESVEVNSGVRVLSHYYPWLIVGSLRDREGE
jgi:hypothetical protein